MGEPLLLYTGSRHTDIDIKVSDRTDGVVELQSLPLSDEFNVDENQTVN